LSTNLSFTKKAISEDVLIHFSPSPVSDFLSGTFEVRTQGRVYCMRLISKTLDNPTTTDRTSKSAIVFRGEAARKFKAHDLKTILGFKKLFGQFVTTQVGDIKWRTSTSTISHDVIEVSDFDFVQIPEGKRRNKVMRRVKIVRIFGILFFTIILLIFLIGTALHAGLLQFFIHLPFLNVIFERAGQAASFAVKYTSLIVSASIVAITIAFLLGKNSQKKKSLYPGIIDGLKGLGYIVD
jgi:hypothetical protein